MKTTIYTFSQSRKHQAGALDYPDFKGFYEAPYVSGDDIYYIFKEKLSTRGMDMTDDLTNTRVNHSVFLRPVPRHWLIRNLAKKTNYFPSVEAYQIGFDEKRRAELIAKLVKEQEQEEQEEQEASEDQE